MPSVKDFEKKHPKRRPGREDHEKPVASEADVKVVDVETGVTESIDAPPPPPMDKPLESEAHHEKNAEKIEISFAGSEMLRAKFPRPFDIAEQVATDWVHDGKFEGLPVGHPLAQVAAQVGLQKAKEIEKKVLNSPVTEKVAMQVLTMGMKAQGLISEIRSKIKKG